MYKRSSAVVYIPNHSAAKNKLIFSAGKGNGLNTVMEREKGRGKQE